MTFEPYIENDKIMSRVAEIGKEISEKYAGRLPLIVCVLNGAFPFAADLFRNLDIDAEITFIRLKSYEGTSSTGVVKQVLGLGENLKGRDVILVEDIIDTGHTIVKLIEDVKAQHPASLAVATLLFKPEALCHDVKPDYVGFSIPKKFIIGYGLDIDGLARNLPDIYAVKEN